MKSIPSRAVLSGVCAGLCSFFTLPVHAEDVGLVAVLKGQQFHQTSEHVVSLGDWVSWWESQEVQDAGRSRQPMHAFRALAMADTPGEWVAGSVTPPGGSPVGLMVEGDELMFEATASSPLELNAAWPDGTYQVEVSTLESGVYQIELDLSGGLYPPVPRLLNYTGMQMVDAAADFTIEWSPMGGTAADFILLSIRMLTPDGEGDLVFESGAPGSPDGLNGTSTQVMVPAGTLEPGQDYVGDLLFVRMADVVESPVLSLAGYYKLTGFGMRAAAVPGTPLGARFLRAVPSNEQMIPRDSVIAFRFSHPMSTNPAHRVVNWQEDGIPFSPAVAYHWTQDDTVLLCEFVGGLPGGKRIDWALSGFRDAAGFLLDGPVQGGFHVSMDDPESPPDVEFVGILKARHFVQDGESPVATGRWTFMADVEATAPNRLKSGNFTALGGVTSGPVFADPWDGKHYETPGEFGMKADLDQFYPNGGYVMDFDGVGDGAFGLTLDLGANDAYPEAPTVTNFVALQAIDPEQEFTIEWEALAGWVADLDELAPGDGVVGLEIYDAYGRDVFDGWDDGPTTGVSQTIPAGTLQPGRTYRVELSFVRVTDLYDGDLEVFAVAGFESVTHFDIRTTGDREMPVVSVTKSGPQAVVTSTGGLEDMAYVLETSDDLQRWHPLAQYAVGSGTFVWQYEDWDAQFIAARFYRLRETGNFEPLPVPVAIQGTVWSDASQSIPVAGAVVGTSLDGATTVTDASGRFYLTTDTPAPAGVYSITVWAGGQLREFGPSNWGDQPREQNLVMD